MTRRRRPSRPRRSRCRIARWHPNAFLLPQACNTTRRIRDAAGVRARANQQSFPVATGMPDRAPMRSNLAENRDYGLNLRSNLTFVPCNGDRQFGKLLSNGYEDHICWGGPNHALRNQAGPYAGRYQSQHACHRGDFADDFGVDSRPAEGRKDTIVKTWPDGTRGNQEWQILEVSERQLLTRGDGPAGLHRQHHWDRLKVMESQAWLAKRRMQKADIQASVSQSSFLGR